MPIPLIAVAAAVAAGGSLVPHAAGGMIVSSAAGYVAGTYLSTAAISTILWSTGVSAAAACGIGAAAVAGLGTAVIGGAGVFGTTVGASGITGVLMSAGLISSTPIAIPVGIAVAGLSGVGAFGYGAVKLRKMRRKVKNRPTDAEIEFTEKEAKLIQTLIGRLRRD